MYYPTLEEIKNRREAGNLIPVYREIVADLETPVSAFLKINRHGYSFLLESVEGGQRLGRYSFIGTEPCKVITVREKDRKDPLEVISHELNRYRVVPIRDLPRFSGGAVGYLSYECVTHFEKLPTPDADPIQVPEAIFMLADTLLIFDHVLHKIKVLTHVSLDEDIDRSYQQAIDRIEDLISRLNQPLPAYPKSGRTSASTGNPTASSREWFENSVRKIKQYINAGEVIQVVLSQRLARPTEASPFEIYRALRTINPSPYMYYLDFQDFQIIGSSPEILVRVDNGLVMTRPLAGTRPRGITQEEDMALEQELRNDVKEKAEHIMLVDLGRNDIGRVSEPGSVVVSELMEIER